MSREHARTTGAGRPARTGAARRVSGRRDPRDLGAEPARGLSRVGSRGACVLSFGGGRCYGFEGFARDAPRDHRLRRTPGEHRGSRRARDDRRSGRRTSARVGPIPVTSVARTLCDLTADRPSMERRAGRRRVAAAQDRDACGALQTCRRGARRARPTPMHGDARDPRTSKLRVTTPARVHPSSGSPICWCAPVCRHRPAASGRRSAGRRYRIDLCYPDLRIAIEYDGWDFHRGRQSFDADRARGERPRRPRLPGPAVHVEVVATRRSSTPCAPLASEHLGIDRHPRTSNSEMFVSAGGQVMQSAPRRMRSSA